MFKNKITLVSVFVLLFVAIASSTANNLASDSGTTATDAKAESGKLMDVDKISEDMTSEAEEDGNSELYNRCEIVKKDIESYMNISTEEPTTEATTTEEPTTEEPTTEEEKVLPNKHEIKMENVLQYPELPTGCESVALTMVLKYYGFKLEKTTIADEYLIYSNSFVTGYSGNPYTYAGGGIYSPGLTKTANIYLDSQHTLLRARNRTGAKPEDLYWYVAKDEPVVVWNTISMLENQPSGEIEEYRGRTYQWDRCEHCVVFCGYDLDRNIVIINDPIDGIVERDAERFWRYYENLGSMALVIE